MSVDISTRAYLKAVMHAAKYPTVHVGGYLIGTLKSSKANEVVVTDVLPVVHGYPVGFVLDLGFTLASKLSSSHSVVGYYFGADSESKETPAYVVDVLADIQAQTHSDTVISARIDFAGLATQESCLKFSVNNRPAKAQIEDQANIDGRLRTALSSRNLAQFADLEAHMDSKEGVADFRNEFVSTLA